MFHKPRETVMIFHKFTPAVARWAEIVTISLVRYKKKTKYAQKRLHSQDSDWQLAGREEHHQIRGAQRDSLDSSGKPPVQIVPTHFQGYWQQTRVSKGKSVAVLINFQNRKNSTMLMKIG